MENLNYDFEGWATKHDVQCSDMRIIRKGAFKHHDGQTVPLVWNHDHDDPYRVLGHALLKNEEEGIRAYCTFNDSDLAKTAKIYVEHGDITHLSIYANQLKQQGNNVMHGMIREVSLVLAGANPGARIENIIKHGEEADEEAIIGTIFEEINLCHSDESENTEEETQDMDEIQNTEETLEHADTESKAEENAASEEDDETVEDVYNSFSEKQKKVVCYMIAKAVENATSDDEDDDSDEEENDNSKGGNNEMKHNVFDQDEVKEGGVLSHSDQVNIINKAKQSSVGSLQQAIKSYVAENESLAHAGLDLGDTDTLEELLPDHKLLNPGAPEILRADQSWVMGVINKIHKSPYSRVRTRHADARAAELREQLKAKGYLRAKGYKKGEEKKVGNQIRLLGRKTEPTTVYLKEELNRDDIIDITDFDVVNYIWSMMKDNMYETLALQALVGDGREDGDADKIDESSIRPIWKDDEFYTIHRLVDFEKAKAELQGSETDAHFGENYIYAETIITESLYGREKFKGTGTPVLYCTPHLVNIINGRRIYDSKSDLAKALNVSAIVEIEQLEGKIRTTEGGEKRKFLGLFVNLADYQFGSTKGGEVTKFDDFDIDFNKYKYLMETRLSGALTEPASAFVLEEPVVDAAG